MARKRRYTELISVYLTEDQYKYFKQVCEQMDMKMTVVMRKIINNVVNRAWDIETELKILDNTNSEGGKQQITINGRDIKEDLLKTFPELEGD